MKIDSIKAKYGMEMDNLILKHLHAVAAGKGEIKGNKPSKNKEAVLNITLYLVMLTV